MLRSSSLLPLTAAAVMALLLAAASAEASPVVPSPRLQASAHLDPKPVASSRTQRDDRPLVVDLLHIYRDASVRPTAVLGPARTRGYGIELKIRF